VNSIVHVAYLNQLAPDLLVNGIPAVTGAGEIMRVIRSRLLQQRQSLSYSFNGVEMIPLPQPNTRGTVDARNGPQPMFCNCTLLTNETFLIVYRIVAHYWENNEVIATGTGAADTKTTVSPLTGCSVLTNRWYETVDINHANFSTRTREGKFLIRSDNKDGFIADQLRTQMAVLGVATNFLRVSSSYTVDPSGLAIAYKIVDQEQFRMPPAPAFKAEGDYTETAVKSGAQRIASVRVRLEGDRNTSQALLIINALTIVATKLKLRNAKLLPKPGALIPLECIVRQDMYHNIVDVSCRATINQTTTDGGGTSRVSTFAGFKTFQIAVPLSDNVVYQPAYLEFGTASLLIKAAAYFDPSVRATFVDPSTRQLFPGKEVGQVGQQGE